MTTLLWGCPLGHVMRAPGWAESRARRLNLAPRCASYAQVNALGGPVEGVCGRQMKALSPAEEAAWRIGGADALRAMR